MALDVQVPKPTFFRWAVSSSTESGILVVTYCLELSLAITEQQSWVSAILAELGVPYHLLSEGNPPPPEY